MANSRALARIIGPSMIALAVTEAMNIDIFAGNPAPVVYLNGMILFAAGVAIAQGHNLWTRDWRVLITLVGWILCLGGLYRLIAPAAPQLAAGPATDVVFGVLIAVGAALSVAGYRRGGR